ncbi:MAG: acyltransferase family protein [Rhizobiaceae bacterium]
MTLEVPASQTQDAASLYLAPLDGLRFFAFLLVFIHHLTRQLGDWHPMADVQAYGWAGVDLFLAISSYLFFHLLSAEHDKAGRINIAWFYIRRLLRIYPLMVLFPLVMLVIFGATDRSGVLRLVGLGLFLDNIITWFRDYNPIRFSSHLWTLSYEFQFYLFLPFIFLAYKRLGQRTFLTLVFGFFLYCFVARMLFYAAGVRHPMIWVTPLLKPESLLAGMCLAIVKPDWNWWWSSLAAVLGVVLFANLPLPWESAFSSAVAYPIIGVTCAAILDVGLRSGAVSRTLSSRPLVALGRISFGLYVYHLLGIHLGLDAASLTIENHDRVNNLGDYGLIFLFSLCITLALSAASYWLIERRFDRLKLRFAVVVGRI